ncbi:MAG: hypothetical protein IJL14_11300 [Selenomonadaceae bacterium]|nr:hypothetical protein [Selenomonadaceae bacterium]
MPDALKDFLNRELEEIKQNKIRAGAIVICFVVAVIFLIADDSGEEIKLNESPKIAEAPPLTKDFPVKDLPVTTAPVEKSVEGVTLVLGANAEPLLIGDPFAFEEKPKPPPKVDMPPVPPIILPKIPEQSQPQPQEKIILTGTAISGSNKTAMFLRGKETLFLTVGDEINGRLIVDISPDFVTFADNVRVYVQKELR